MAQSKTKRQTDDLYWNWSGSSNLNKLKDYINDAIKEGALPAGSLLAVQYNNGKGGTTPYFIQPLWVTKAQQTKAWNEEPAYKKSQYNKEEDNGT